MYVSTLNNFELLKSKQDLNDLGVLLLLLLLLGGKVAGYSIGF